MLAVECHPCSAPEQHFRHQGHANQLVAVSDVSKPLAEGLVDVSLGDVGGLASGKNLGVNQGYRRLVAGLHSSGVPKDLFKTTWQLKKPSFADLFLGSPPMARGLF